MAIVEDVNAILVQQRLHGLPHLVELLEGGVGGVPGVVRVADHPAGSGQHVTSCEQQSMPSSQTLRVTGPPISNRKKPCVIAAVKGLQVLRQPFEVSTFISIHKPRASHQGVLMRSMDCKSFSSQLYCAEPMV